MRSSRLARALSGLIGCILAGLVLACTPALAVDSEPQLSEAQAAIVVDSEGQVLFAKNPDAEINMASITKIMTAVVALESGTPLDSTITTVGVTLDENAMVAGYKAGMTTSFRNLMKAMLVHSANDAASEVAVAVAGSEDAFVALMNEKANELGLTHTHFANPHGLDAEGHYSSVSDLVTLARYAMTTQPFIAETVRLEEVTVPIGSTSVTFETTDQFLLEYEGALGIKTGVGNEVTSFLGCARRDGTTLYACVLGCTTKEGRFTDTEALMDWAWEAYDRHRLSFSAAPVSVEPFAYHFGLSCVSYADRTTYGLSWPEGGDTSWRRISTSSGALTEPGQTTAVCQWSQDGRVIASCSYTASKTLVPTRSSITLFDRLAEAGSFAASAEAA